MATLVLTAVGTALAGPIGGAIGAIVGQSFDQNVLFAPKPRQGPRLGELAVQTSSYGTQIPKIFGTMRVAGTVIWSTDLIETRSTSGGGKGAPKTVNYSYSASFAVALSARPIRSVGRIWAEGKLLRGAAGDFKSATGFRLHPGDEDQLADPLIAASEGAAAAPAFRGIAYALFEDLQLADFGNRIPSLTFEIEADSGPVEIGAIAEALGAGALAAGTAPAVRGYAVTGDNLRDAIAPFTQLLPLDLVDEGAQLRIGMAEGEPAVLDPAQEQGRRALTRAEPGRASDEVAIAYYDVARDYQAGLQRAIVGATPNGTDRTALPAAMSAEEAKGLAEKRLANDWTARTTVRTRGSWRRAALRPGRLVSLSGEAGTWSVRGWTLGAQAVELELRRVALSPAIAIAASPGAAVPPPDLVHGPTVLALLDLPLGDPVGNRPILFAAAAGEEPGWRRALLSVSYDGGGSWLPAGETAATAVIGRAIDALPNGGSELLDCQSTVEVELATEEMWLEGRSDDALVGGANLAVLGDELIQFGTVEPLGGGRFRLSHLLRGRRGTEWAAAGHGAGDRFVLLEAASLAPLEAPGGSIGAEARLLASGIGDVPDPAADSQIIEGASLQPPSPVHLSAEPTAEGGVLIRWVRRSRLGWTWDAGEIPLGEATELYRVEISGGGFSRTATVTVPQFLYTAEQRFADGGGPIDIAVVQVGAFATSRAAHSTLA